MSCSLVTAVIVVGICMLWFVDISNCDFFSKYNLNQHTAHLDANADRKLKRKYWRCVRKLNSEDKNNKNDQIPSKF